MHIGYVSTCIGDWSELRYCDAAQDCLEHYPDITTQCLRVESLADKNGDSKAGICVPLECSADDSQCPSIGDECGSGVLSGVCNTNTQECNYHPHLLIASCRTPAPPLTNSESSGTKN